MKFLWIIQQSFFPNKSLLLDLRRSSWNSWNFVSSTRNLLSAQKYPAKSLSFTFHVVSKFILQNFSWHNGKMFPELGKSWCWSEKFWGVQNLIKELKKNWNFATWKFRENLNFPWIILRCFSVTSWLVSHERRRLDRRQNEQRQHRLLGSNMTKSLKKISKFSSWFSQVFLERASMLAWRSHNDDDKRHDEWKKRFRINFKVSWKIHLLGSWISLKKFYRKIWNGSSIFRYMKKVCTFV